MKTFEIIYKLLDIVEKDVEKPYQERHTLETITPEEIGVNLGSLLDVWLKMLDGGLIEIRGYEKEKPIIWQMKYVPIITFKGLEYLAERKYERKSG